MAAEHAELVMEMQTLEKLPHSERVKHAKKRRAQQMKVYQQYEKKMEKDSRTVRKSKGQERLKSNRGLQFAQSTLLFDAAIRNDLEEAESLLRSGVDPNLVGGDSLSVLHQCCLNDLPEMMKLFVRHGADVNSRDCDNWTPLHLAATCGNINLCQCLCDNNADLLALNTDGNMPYDLCDDMATLDFIESEMAKRGITQELIDETRLTSENEMLEDLEVFVGRGGDLNFKGPNGETLLHIAACMGYGRVIEFLLKRKVPVNSADNEGWQAHHMATYYGQYHVLESLLLGGADPNARTQSDDTMIDLCDLEAQAKVHALILDIQNRGKQRLSTPSTLDRTNSTRRGSQATLHPGRRSSIHDKATMAHREAIMEGQRLQGSIVRMEEDEDEEAEIEIPAITITAKTPDIRVEKPKTPPKSILKRPVSKTVGATTPKHDPKDAQIWRESTTATGVTTSEAKSSPTSEDRSPIEKSSDRRTSRPSGKSPIGRQNISSNSERPNGERALALPKTLPEMKNKRKSEREVRRPNGVAQNKNGPEKSNFRDGRKHKFSDREEVASSENDGRGCCVVS